MNENSIGPLKEQEFSMARKSADGWRAILKRVRNTPNFRGRLNLKACGLTSIPEELLNDVNLCESVLSLNLSENQLEEIPDGIGHFTNLEDLDLSHNPLSERSNWIALASLPNLHSLNVSCNKSECFLTPKTAGDGPNAKSIFKLLRHLKKLTVSTLPDFEPGDLPRLEVLQLNNNQLRSVPSSIAYLTNLRHLYLYHNLLSDVPDCLADMPHLETVDVQSNNLICLPRRMVLATNIDEILPEKLWLGDYEAACNCEALKFRGITHVLSISDTNFPCFSQSCMTHKTVVASDVESEDLSVHFEECVEFIDEGIQSGGRVLVHCMAGVSRSATITAAYLMNSHGLTADQAIEYVRQRRPVIEPNEGFVAQLRAYETTLTSRQDSSGGKAQLQIERS